MLAILGGLVDDEISSGSSDDSDQVSDHHDKTIHAEKPGIPSRESMPSQRFLSPGVPAHNASCKRMNVADRDKSQTCFSLKFDQLRKFQELQDQREKAAEEKIPEGYRRRRRRKRRHPQNPGNGEDDEFQPDKKLQTDQQSGNPSASPLRSSEAGPSKQDQEKWDTLKGYLDVNSHISQGVDHGHLATDKSGLEKRLDEAIAEGDFETAEKLSEDLSTRDLGCRIAKAANARDYMKWKSERDEEKAAKKRKKKKKLAWGFEVKNRWEMKANM